MTEPEILPPEEPASSTGAYYPFDEVGLMQVMFASMVAYTICILIVLAPIAIGYSLYKRLTS